MKTKKIIFCIFLLFNALWVFADPTPPPVLPDGSVASAPIDKGLITLLIGGMILGIRQWQIKKKNFF